MRTGPEPASRAGRPRLPRLAKRALAPVGRGRDRRSRSAASDVRLRAARSGDGDEREHGAKFVALNAPDGMRFSEQSADLAVAPDGQSIAVVASTDDGTPRLYLRRFDDPAWRALPGTETRTSRSGPPTDARSDSSPRTGSRRSRSAAAPPTAICDAAAGRGGHVEQGRTDRLRPGQLRTVHAGQGRRRRRHAGDGARRLAWRGRPPLSRGSSPTGGTSCIRRSLRVTAVTKAGSRRSGRRIEPRSSRPTASPTFAPPDRLVFRRNKTLYVQSFDPGTGRLAGEPRRSSKPGSPRFHGLAVLERGGGRRPRFRASDRFEQRARLVQSRRDSGRSAAAPRRAIHRGPLLPRRGTRVRPPASTRTIR